MTDEEEKTHQDDGLIFKNSVPFDVGCDEESMQEMIDRAVLEYPNKNVCAVRQWAWWDYKLEPEVYEQYRNAGFYPSIIFASCIIWDKNKRWQPGYSVKTTFLVAFENNCFFITRSSVYILVGRGRRESVDPGVAEAIHF